MQGPMINLDSTSRNSKKLKRILKNLKKKKYNSKADLPSYFPKWISFKRELTKTKQNYLNGETDTMNFKMKSIVTKKKWLNFRMRTKN